MEKEKLKKPLVLEIEEAEKEIFAAVEAVRIKHDLPFTFLEPIISSLCFRMREGRERERAAARSYFKDVQKGSEGGT